MSGRRPQVTVVGAAACGARLARVAYDTGRALGRAGAALLCGGRGGVMAAACEGAASAGGLTIGILPGEDAARSPANPHVQIALYTGLGQARNLVLVLSGDAVIAIGGGWGTLSEIALAVKHGKRVVLLESWSLARPDGEPEPLLLRAATPAEAVEMALARSPSS